MIEQIEKIHAQLHLDFFSQTVVFGEAEIEVLVVRSNESIAAQVAEVLRSGEALAARVQTTGNLKCAQVEKLPGRARSGKGIANQVRPAEELSAPIKVSTKEIHIEGLAGVQGQISIGRPSGREPRPGMRVGKLIGIKPGEVLAHIEVGTGPLQVRTKAVVRLAGVGDKIQSIAGIIQRVRPDVIQR